jgi:branched-chain amino acid transport system substrate-binding protein
MRIIHRAVVIAAVVAASSATAQYSGGTVKIGILTDMSGIYSDIGGPGSVIAAKLAVEDFRPTAKGMKVEIVSGDMQNKPDVGVGIANTWFDVNNVDVIVDGMNSGVSLAVSEVTRQKNKLFLVTGAATSDLTGPKCSPNTIHWVYDTWALAHSNGKSMVETGGDSWFFITADYAFGYALERDATAVIEASGGKVVGRVRVPTNTNDFSSYLLQAQASKAKVIGLAIAGGDAINAIKQAGEFGIVEGGQNIAALLLWASDVAALGLPTTQGVALTEAWYWDMNDNSRAWTKRWQAERPGKVPTSAQAGVYSAVTHYLKTVEAMESHSDGRAVAAKMKETPTDDVLYGTGTIRVDGRKIHDMHLFEVKKPGESRYFGDFYKLRATIPATEAFRPLKDGGCPLVAG